MPCFMPGLARTAEERRFSTCARKRLASVALGAPNLFGILAPAGECFLTPVSKHRLTPHLTSYTPPYAFTSILNPPPKINLPKH